MKKIIIAVAALVGLLFLFVLYPNNLFAKRKAFREFNLYSNKEIKGDYQPILNKAIDIVKSSELYDSNYRYDIFLTDGSFYKKVVFRLIGPSLARSIDNNILLNISADFSQNLLIGPKNKRDLTLTIAHEMVHCLQVNKFGAIQFNPLHHPPLWKVEGYPEYVANRDEINAPGYNFAETVKKLRAYEARKAEWVELHPGYFDPIVYFKGRVMMEYLINIKGMSYEQILSENITEEGVDREMRGL